MSRLEHIWIGPTPADEPCLQVGSPEYSTIAARAECAEFARQLTELCPPPADTVARFGIRTERHDFGSYHEVVAYFDPDDRRTVEWAYSAEALDVPHWLPGFGPLRAEEAEAC